MKNKHHNPMRKIADFWRRIEKSVYICIIFLLVGVILGNIFLNNHFTYEPVILTKQIELKNNNRFISEKYISVDCTEGVDVTLHNDAYYISTWQNNKTDYGVCTIKYVDVRLRLK